MKISSEPKKRNVQVKNFKLEEKVMLVLIVLLAIVNNFRSYVSYEFAYYTEVLFASGLVFLLVSLIFRSIAKKKKRLSKDSKTNE